MVILFIKQINTITMTEKFQGKYRIPSARASWWNYGDSAGYFITLCTQHRRHYFGEIVMDHGGHVETPCMASLPSNPPPSSSHPIFIPTAIGQRMADEWLKTLSLRPDMSLELDAWTVMPNHFHAIIWIGDNAYNRRSDVGMSGMGGVPETPGMASLRTSPSNAFGPQSKNLSSILRGFKSAVTTFAVKNHLEFGWQERFWDHILRDEQSYTNVKNYILQNVQNWKSDKFYQ